MNAELEFDYATELGLQRAALSAAVEKSPIAEALAARDVSDVMVDPTGQVFFDHLDGRRTRHAETMRPKQIRSIIDRIAGMLGKKLDNRMLEGEVPIDGSRIQAWLPPLVPAPSLVIRKHRKQGVDGWPALTLADYAMPSSFRRVLESIAQDRKTMLICGSTGAGKSAFGGAFLDLVTKVHPADRIVTIEDTYELYCRSESWLALHTSPQVSQRMLLRSALRALPTWIIIGEARDEVAIDLVESLTTDHAGFSTTHAATPEKGLTRIWQLTRGALTPKMVASAFDYVVQMKRRPPPDGRRYPESIHAVRGYAADEFQLEPVT